MVNAGATHIKTSSQAVPPTEATSAQTAFDAEYRALLAEYRQQLEAQRQQIEALHAIIQTLSEQQAPKYDLRGAQFGGGFAETVQGDQVGSQ